MSKKALKYSDTKYILLKRKKRAKGFFVFLFCVIIFVFMLFASSVFTDVLKVGNFSFLFSNSVKINSHSYYAISMGEYKTDKEAQNVASGVSVMGAGAYVWFNQGVYYVLGNAYENLLDAQTVLKNVSGNNYDVKIKEIKYNKITINSNDYSDEQKQVLLNAIKNIDNIFKNCYNYSIQFDKGEVVSTVVSSRLNTLKSDVKIWQDKVDLINSVVVTNQGLYIKNAYIGLISELENAVLKVIDGTSVNKDLKYLTCAVSIIKYDLYNNINNL